MKFLPSKSMMLVAAMMAGASVASAADPAASKEVEVVQARPDTVIKRFVYHPQTVYEIRCREGMFTHIVPVEGEKILGFYLSDTTFWKFVVAKDGSRVLVRPTDDNRYNSATMITDKHTYELAFRSFAPEEPYWFQRVEFSREDDGLNGWGMFADPAETAIASGKQTAAENAKANAKQDWTVDVSKANFAYAIKDRQEFSPLIVFDDGVFTYMKMPKLQDMPAVFAFDDNADQFRIVDYVVRDGNIIVHRVSRGFILKLGDKTSIVEAAR